MVQLEVEWLEPRKPARTPASVTISGYDETKGDRSLYAQQHRTALKLIQFLEQPKKSFVQAHFLWVEVRAMRPLFVCRKSHGNTKQRATKCLSVGDCTRYAIDYSKLCKSPIGSICVHGVMTEFTVRGETYYTLSAVNEDGCPRYACFPARYGALMETAFVARAQRAINQAVRLAGLNGNLPRRNLCVPQKNEVFLHTHEAFVKVLFDSCRDADAARECLENEIRKNICRIPRGIIDNINRCLGFNINVDELAEQISEEPEPSSA